MARWQGVVIISTKYLSGALSSGLFVNALRISLFRAQINHGTVEVALPWPA